MGMTEMPASDALAPAPSSANRLLAALPRAEYLRLLSYLEPVSLEYRQSLYDAHTPIPYVWFIERGVASVIRAMKDGTLIEISVIGHEGMVGLPVFLGSESTPSQAIIQIPGAGQRMPVAVFRREVPAGSPLHDLLHRYTQTLINQMAQGMVCNRMHSIAQRCARWLLLTHDRVDSDQFPLTQQFLAQMLGVRRASVGTMAGKLQKAGLIRYSRGVITILDRPGLEAAVCECYQIIEAEYDRLLG
ncbi:MAG TPA: Crp/Fnr family transcriptional regulator [Chloroflexota bacterium]|nr:Crp/Fnr family transcriptional regulator [Chloroflexota bacterium]